LLQRGGWCITEKEKEAFMPVHKKTATLALLVRDGHLLLGQRIRKNTEIGELTLNGPGGKVEKGQTVEESLIEEVEKEVGISVAASGLADGKVGVITFYTGARSVWVVHVYLVTEFSGEPQDSEEMRAFGGVWWYPIDQLPFDLMLASDPIWIPRALSGKRFCAEVFQSSDGKYLYDFRVTSD